MKEWKFLDKVATVWRNYVVYTSYNKMTRNNKTAWIKKITLLMIQNNKMMWNKKQRKTIK